MYLIAAGVPLGIAIVWAATPGNMPGPFHPRMIQPPAADLLAGVMWYFAALLVVLRRARWFGSKLLPFGLSFVIEFYVVQGAHTFTQGLVLIAATIVILALGAWGTYGTGGSYDPQPRSAKAAQATSLLFGCGLFVAVIAMIASEGLRSLVRGPYVDEHYEVDRAGQIMRVTYVNGTPWRVKDLNGNPLPDFPSDRMADAQKLWERRVGFAQLELNARRTSNDIAYRSFHDPRHNIRLLETGNGLNWYWVGPRNTIEAYDVFTRRYVGGIGSGGFVAAPNRPTPFAEPIRPSGHPDFLLTARTAYWLDLSARSLKPMVSVGGDDADRIVSAAALTTQTSLAPQPYYRLVATTRKVFVFAVDKLLFEAPLDRRRAEQQDLNVADVQGPSPRFVIWYTPSQRFRDSRLSRRFVEYSASGKVLREYDLPPLPDLDAERDRPYRMAAAAALPIAGYEAAKVFGWLLEGTPLRWGPLDREAKQALFLVLLVGALCAGVTSWLTWRYALPPRRRIGWTVGNVVLGIPGLMTLVSLPEWPARVNCPTCGKSRAVTRERCEHCGAPFGPPLENGTEIFD
jgi:hypothetical protein